MITHIRLAQEKFVRAVFADTFDWIALTVPHDAAHTHAQKVEADIITTDEVLSEYLTFFSRASGHLRRKAADGVRAILQDASALVIPQRRETFLPGVELFNARPDKGYSLVDCISMQRMHRRIDRCADERPAWKQPDAVRDAGAK
jgi:uncharacterized protein